MRALRQACKSEAEQASLLREARSRFNKAVRLEKGLRLGLTHLGLALCHWHLGDRANAKQSVKKVDSARETTPFAEVVKEHWTAVYRLLYSLAGNTHAAEDLTQDTFLRALDRYSSFEPGTCMRAWLLRIATNAFFDEQRRRKRRPAASLDHDPPGSYDRVGHALETAEQAALVREALQKLSELTRLVFHLRAQEDLSFREIADLAGTTEQSARWHMHQARSKLLEWVGDEL